MTRAPSRWREIRSTLAVVLVAGLVAAACGDLTPDSLAYATDEAQPTVIRIATPRIAGFEEVARCLLPKRLRAFRIIPHVGLLEFALYFSQAL